MRPKFFIHIGAAKTGSSAIQTFLRRNAQTLAEHGYLVPDRHLGLSASITGEHVWAFQERIVAGDRAGLVARLNQAAELAGDDKTLLLSAENLSNLGNHTYLADALKDHGAQIALYVRRQDELLTSAWQQWHCKVEGDFNAWLVRGLKTYGQWDRLAGDWERVVGEGNVAVRIFEKDALVGGDLLTDFVDALGLTEKRETFDYDIGVVNPSFTDIITPLVAGNTRLFEDANDNRFFNFLLEIDQSAFAGAKKASIISRALRESICAYYQDINTRVRLKYFPARPQLFAAIDHSKYNYLEGQALLTAQLQFLLEFTFRSAQAAGKRK